MTRDKICQSYHKVSTIMHTFSPPKLAYETDGRQEWTVVQNVAHITHKATDKWNTLQQNSNPKVCIMHKGT